MPGTALDTTIALVSLEEFKEHFKTSDSSDDALLNALINGASRACNIYTDRQLLSKAHVDYYNGSGKAELILKNYPVTTLSSLYVTGSDRDFTDSEYLITSADYILKKNMGIIELWNNESAFTIGRANVKVSYTAGYVLASVPADIKLAVNMWVAQLYQKADKRLHSIQSQSVGEMTTTFDVAKIPDYVKALLNPHRKMHWSPDYAYSD